MCLLFKANGLKGLTFSLSSINLIVSFGQSTFYDNFSNQKLKILQVYSIVFKHEF